MIRGGSGPLRERVLFMGDMLLGESASSLHGMTLHGVEKSLWSSAMRGLLSALEHPGCTHRPVRRQNKTQATIPFLKVTLLGSSLIFSDLNVKFPSPSREFSENMRGTQITIRRRQKQPKVVSFLFFFFLIFNFFWLCGMWGLSSPTRDPAPLQWERRGLTTGPPGKSWQLPFSFEVFLPYHRVLAVGGPNSRLTVLLPSGPLGSAVSALPPFPHTCVVSKS